MRVALGADRRRFEEGFLTALSGGSPATVEIPVPDFTVRFSSETCELDGPATFTAEPGGAVLVVEVANETEASVAVLFGLHEGVTLEQLVAFVAEVDQQTEAPPFWEETGLVLAFRSAVTGGSVTARLELVTGSHAVICVTQANDSAPRVLGDIVIVPGTG